MNREPDKFVSAIILLAFGIIWILSLAIGNFSEDVSKGISIALNIMLILTYLVLLYNAWGAFDSIIFKIIFLVIALFLILCIVATWIPALDEILALPSIGF